MGVVVANYHSLWRPLSQLRRDISPEWLYWLRDVDSLTEHLKRLSRGQFAVELLAHGYARPFRVERSALSLGECERALVRQVRLLCCGQAVVFARTVIPVASLSGKYRLLARLGTRPLGELLFSDRTMRRGEVEVAEFPFDHRVFRGLTREDLAGAMSIWGRRSLFYLMGKPLLVSEFFLPQILKLDVKTKG